MLRTGIVVALVVSFVAILTACGWDWTVVPKSDAGANSKCSRTEDCRGDEFCAFFDWRCGKGEGGQCLPASLASDCEDVPKDQYDACGCDGQTRANQCAVGAARTDLSIEASCTAPADTFRCGYLFCPRTTYCFELRTPKGLAFSCADCGGPTCACKDITADCKAPICSESAGATTVVCTE